MKQLKIGIVGSQFIANLHMITFQKLNQSKFQIQGVTSKNPENAKNFVAKYKLVKAYDSYDEMLADPEIDVVDLCTPNDLHRDMIVSAAKAGKHIICEKPLTGAFGCDRRPQSTEGGVSKKELLQEALDNVKTCKDAVCESGITFCYAENWVYAPPFKKMKRLLRKSSGTIFDVRAESSHSGSIAEYANTWKQAGGGSMVRLGAHPVGAALHIKHWEGLKKFGKPIRPKSVTAEVGYNTKIESFIKEEEKYIKHGWVDVEDWSCAIITFEDTTKATVISSDCALGGVRNKLEVYTSNAVINVNITPNNTLQIYAPREGIFKDEYIQEKLETDGGWNFPAADEEWIRGYDAELEDFIDSIREQREPLSGLLLAEDTMRVIYSAYVSAEEGKRIEIC